MYTKSQILKVLEKVYNNSDKFIVGQQIFDEPENYIEPFTAETGCMPGMLGFDLGCYGLNLKTISQGKWQDRINYITEYAENGGIVTISSHFDNPTELSERVRGHLGKEHTREAYLNNFRDLITEGTEINRVFKEELTVDGKFLADLRDNGVAVLWRPLHEMNGGWFWYHLNQDGIWVDPNCIKKLWIYIYNYYVNELGLDNLIWVYSPNVAPDATRTTMLCYPGDEYVDLVGVDWYTGGKLEIENHNDYMSMIKLTGKVGAICEFGPGGEMSKGTPEEQIKVYNCMDFLGNMLELKDRGYKFSYVLGWTGKLSWVKMGKACEFMKSEFTLGQAEVKELLDSYAGR